MGLERCHIDEKWHLVADVGGTGLFKSVTTLRREIQMPCLESQQTARITAIQSRDIHNQLATK